MPLEVQALLPFAVLLAAAGLMGRPGFRRATPAMAPAATAIATAMALVLLLELKPSERVDLLFVRAFPGADLAIRLDGLSLAFAVVLLASASGLMLARLRATGDRRNPWRRWLLTAAAALWVVTAGNLLLTYIALQVLTLAWSGALDEAAPRARPIRLTQQAGDLALLVAAASAIRSSGTSAFAGMPADVIGPVLLLFLLVPVVTRVAAVVVAGAPPPGTVAFIRPVAWVAPAAALFFRSLSLAAGRPLDRPVQVAVFAAALAVGLALVLVAASTSEWSRFAAAMVAAQASVMVAFGILQNPLGTTGSAWLALQLVLVAGLTCLQPREQSIARGIATLMLGLMPPAAAFTAVWIGMAGITGSRALAAGIPLGLLVLLSGWAVLRHLRRPSVGVRWPEDPLAVVLLLVTLVPAPFAWGLALPLARTVRTIPTASFQANWLGVLAGAAPLLPVLVIGATAIVAWVALTRAQAPARLIWPRTISLRFAFGGWWPASLERIPWQTVTWVGYAVLLALLVRR